METAQGLSSRLTAATISAAGAGCEIRPWFCDFMVLYGAAIKRMMLRIGGGNYPVIAVRNSVTGFCCFCFVFVSYFRSIAIAFPAAKHNYQHASDIKTSFNLYET